MSGDMHLQPLTVAVWNILFDKAHGSAVEPQFARLESIIDTLGKLGNSVAATALLEVEESQMGHHGTIITEKLGYASSSWARHSRKREHIGVLGNDVAGAEFIEIGHNKKAVITRLGDVAIAALHLKRPHNRQHLREQVSQMDVFLEYLTDEDTAVIMGDFNGLPWQKPRRMLEAAGYESVFSRSGKRHPATVPTRSYEHLLTARERVAVRMAGGLLSVDGIYIKGQLEVIEAGTLEGDSDHRLVYATLGHKT